MDPLSFLSPRAGGGEELLPAFPGGVTDRRDRREVRDGVLYGVSAGVGRAGKAGIGTMTGPVDSSSVSQGFIVDSRKTSCQEAMRTGLIISTESQAIRS